MPSVILGTGDKNSFLGEGQTIFQPTAIVDTELGYLGRFRAADQRRHAHPPLDVATYVEQRDQLHHAARRSWAPTSRPAARSRSRTRSSAASACRTASCRRSSTWSASSTATTASTRHRDRDRGAASETMKPSAEAIGAHQALPGAQLVLRDRRRLQGLQRLRRGDAARVRRLHLRAVDWRPRRRRLQGRRRPVPGRSRGLRRLRGRGRLPRARQRQGRHPRRSTTSARTSPRPRTATRTRTAAPTRPPSIATATASPTTSTSAPTIRRTSTASRTRTAAPIPTTTRTASRTSTTLPERPRGQGRLRGQDGCPDPDNDHDRILDVNDKCPNEPETYNGVKDDDGCPDKGLVDRPQGQARVLDKRSTSRPTRTYQARVVPAASTRSPRRSTATRGSS